MFKEVRTLEGKRPEPEFMTLEEVAEYLRISINTLYKMVQQKRIPALKVGRLWRFRKDEIDAWMRECANQGRGRQKGGNGQRS